MTGNLLHICGRDDWAAAQQDGRVAPDSLDTVGFVHLSTPAQVHLPANRLFAGRRDLVLLHVAPERLSDLVRYEPGGVPDDPESMRFPHLYGPLPVGAVVDVTPVRAGSGRPVRGPVNRRAVPRSHPRHRRIRQFGQG